MYLKWHEQTLAGFSPSQVEADYAQGYLFGREEKGKMYQTRSVRIDMGHFELSSENRRVLRKVEGIQIEAVPLPLADYHWSIGKLAKDFYDTKFGSGVFSANKTKEILTNPEKSNFNTVLHYHQNGETLGYVICYQSNDILHYSYPFYDLKKSPANMGIGMMTQALVLAKDQGKKFVYLGGTTRPSDVYKFQFAGVEWFDGTKWQIDTAKIKNILQNTIITGLKN